MRQSIHFAGAALLCLLGSACAVPAGPGAPVPQRASADSSWLGGRTRVAVALYPLAATTGKSYGAHYDRLSDSGWGPAGEEPAGTVRGLAGALRVAEGQYGAELMVSVDQDERKEQYRGAGTFQYFSFTQQQYSAVVLVTGEFRPVRLGVGVGVRQTDMDFSTGECECWYREEQALISPGLAADLAVTLPWESRFFSELRVQARAFRKRNSRYEPSYEDFETGGFELLVGVGAGYRVLR